MLAISPEYGKDQTMTWDNFIDVINAITFSFGILYALFGKGPDIPFVPPWLNTLSRLVYPAPIFLFQYLQDLRKQQAIPNNMEGEKVSGERYGHSFTKQQLHDAHETTQWRNLRLSAAVHRLFATPPEQQIPLKDA